MKRTRTLPRLMLLLMLTAGLTLEPEGLLVGWGIPALATELNEDSSDDVAFETELPEVVELLEMFANRVSFSGIYLLDGERIYSLRIDNAMFYQDKVKELKKDLEGDNFKEDSRPGRDFENAIRIPNSNNLFSKIVMYNGMDMGISYLEGTLEGDRYVFTKIDARIETHPDGSQEIIENKCE